MIASISRIATELRENTEIQAKKNRAPEINKKKSATIKTL
jgi:hypothetical protein